jgi:hypothetical protein
MVYKVRVRVDKICLGQFRIEKGLGGEQEAPEKSRKMTSKGPVKDREKGRVQEAPKKSSV